LQERPAFEKFKNDKVINESLSGNVCKLESSTSVSSGCIHLKSSSSVNVLLPCSEVILNALIIITKTHLDKALRTYSRKKFYFSFNQTYCDKK